MNAYGEETSTSAPNPTPVQEDFGRERFQLPLAPWVFDPRRRLPEPHFVFQTPEGRIFLLADAPAAFKSRNLFVTGNALDRV
jgi:hypothetical protein